MAWMVHDWTSVCGSPFQGPQNIVVRPCHSWGVSLFSLYTYRQQESDILPFSDLNLIVNIA